MTLAWGRGPQTWLVWSVLGLSLLLLIVVIRGKLVIRGKPSRGAVSFGIACLLLVCFMVIDDTVLGGLSVTTALPRVDVVLPCYQSVCLCGHISLLFCAGLDPSSGLTAASESAASVLWRE